MLFVVCMCVLLFLLSFVASHVIVICFGNLCRVDMHKAGLQVGGLNCNIPSWCL